MHRRSIRMRLILGTGLALMLITALQAPTEAGRRFTAIQNALFQTKPAPAAANDPGAGVEITAQALPANKFCALGPKAYVVYVPMDITVANGRHTPIILTRYLHVQRVLIARNNNDAQAHKYELATPVRAYRSFREMNFGPLPSDDSFVVLKHNQTYEFTAVEGVPVRNDPAENIPGTAYPGDLALSIELQTWPFSREAGIVQRDWTKFGDLISTPVISFPTIIKLPANPVTEKCGLLAP